MKPLKSQTGESGFTLLELLVTLTIASLLVTVVAPRIMGSIAHARLTTSAAQVAVALRETRSTAIATSQPASLTIDGSGHSYSAVGKEIKLPSGQTLVLQPYSQTSDIRQTYLEFQPDGSSSGGTITIEKGSDHVRVMVDWLTGRVSLRD